MEIGWAGISVAEKEDEQHEKARPELSRETYTARQLDIYHRGTRRLRGEWGKGDP